MAPVALSDYLNTIRHNLRLDNIAEGEVLRELRAHIEDKLEELKEKGLSEEEAAKVCLKVMGSAKLVARQLYEARGPGSKRYSPLYHIYCSLCYLPSAGGRLSVGCC